MAPISLLCFPESLNSVKVMKYGVFFPKTWSPL